MFNVYLITNVKSKKKYVGFTSKTLPVRLEYHIRAARNGSSQLLHTAMREAGFENFKIEPLSELRDKAAAGILEGEMIVKLNTLKPNGYNVRVMGRPRTRFFTPKQQVRALKLREEGVTRRRIATDLGVDYQLLCAWLRTDA